MKAFSTFLVLLSVILWSSCRKDFESVTNPGTLEFSRDTVFFDTLFTSIKSSTQTLVVYNTSDDAISIPEIYLERGTNSNYQLNVDGLPQAGSVVSESTGKSFTNIEILANDSIFIFAELLVDLATDADELDEESAYNDKILFSGIDNTQEVPLISLVNDAFFIVKDEGRTEREFETTTRNESGNFETVEGYNLATAELNWTNEKAYVIYGNVVVPSGETLSIDAGARIHFHEDSGLIVEDGARLEINGAASTEEDSLENQVIIESDRIAEDFDNLPGQWNFIWFQQGSSGAITNTTIKNSTIGLLVEGTGSETTANLNLRNIEIYDSQVVGLQSNAAFITAENVVINQANEASLYINEGGTYNFDHCTLVNTSGLGFALSMGNTATPDSRALNTDLEANFTNCIILGSGNGQNQVDLAVSEVAAFNFNFNFSHCLLEVRTSLQSPDNPEYNFDNPELYTSCIFNEDPDFKRPGANELNIGEDSAANGEALSNTNTTDILGTMRSGEAPDIGAYESTIFEEEETEESTE